MEQTAQVAPRRVSSICRKGMIMHLYLSVAHRTGSARAVELAEQLSTWHDDMVVHARAVARGGAARCDDSCPHARAVELWRTAREILGDAADRLVFLKTAAAESFSRQKSSRRHHGGKAEAVGLPLG
jgi:hypothetical protein